ncbi:MAG: ribbon-helix-helix domain-containing protein [Pseudolabrys sp.]|nr:ribbon-helix-helix domain-containing protein [Pseudolabrys sp.]MDP2296321.1 ribbon-helix-helix domain-containing protein [Pseudolabrys sp.]
MNSAIIKRSVVVAGKKTSVSLEDTFWLALKEIAHQKHVPLGQMLDLIADGRDNANLSSAVRQYVMQHYYNAAQSARPVVRPDFVLRSVAGA